MPKTFNCPFEDTLLIPIAVQSQTAHNFPSGTSFNREAWMEIKVINNNNIIYESGVVENHEDLNCNDNDLLFFKSFLYDENNNLTHIVTQVDSMLNFAASSGVKKYLFISVGATIGWLLLYLLTIPSNNEPFEKAKKDLSPMALSFWQENRRVSNKMLCEELGYKLHQPDFHTGLKDCLLQEK